MCITLSKFCNVTTSQRTGAHGNTHIIILALELRQAKANLHSESLSQTNPKQAQIPFEIQTLWHRL